MDKFNFGLWLKVERTRKGILAKDLAKMTGLTSVSISRYETGERMPNVETAVKLMNALGVETINIEDFQFPVKEETENTEEPEETAKAEETEMTDEMGKDTGTPGVDTENNAEVNEEQAAETGSTDQL